MSEKKDGWTILQDISAILMRIFIPLYVLLQVIKGISYFEPLSIEWWMVIALLLVMVNSNVMQLNELDRLKKYSGTIVRFLATYKKTNKKCQK